MMQRAIMVDRHDNVATALQELRKGDCVSIDDDETSMTTTTLETIPSGFKLAVRDIDTGQPVIKYGEVIGLATKPISKGACVHVHNVEGLKGRGDKL